MPVSILILAKNEADLSGCLKSVNWSDDVHVFDTSRSDHTQTIAARHGARLTRCDLFSDTAERTAALDSISFRYPWLLILEAHERVTVGLKSELNLRMYHSGPEMTYRIQRRERFKRDKSDPHHLSYFPADSVRGLNQDLKQAAAHKQVSKDRIPWLAFRNFVNSVIFKGAFLSGRAGIARACLGWIHDCNISVKRIRRQDTKPSFQSPVSGQRRQARRIHHA